jgi:O-antigen/teichoic acid export membrane protein
MGRQTAALLLGRSVGFVFLFIAAVILARCLPQADFGVYRQAFLVQDTLLMLLGFGLPASLYYFLQDEERAARRYVSHTLVALIATGTLGAILIWLTTSWWSGLFHEHRLAAFGGYIGVLVATTLVGSLLEAVLIGTQRAQEASVAYMITDIARATLVVAVVLAGHGIAAILIAFTLVNCARIIALLLYLAHANLLSLRPLAMATLTRQLRYAIPFWCATILDVIAASAPQYYLSWRHDARTFAIFAVGCLSVPFVAIVYMSVSDVVLVQMTRLERVGARPQALAALADGIRRVSLLCLPLFVLLEVLASEMIVTLYGDRFAASVPIFRTWLLLLPLIALQIDYVLRAYGDTGFLFIISAVRASVCVALLPLLISWLGLPGAALAFVLGLVVSRILVLGRLRRLTGQDFAALVPWGALGRITVAAAVAAAPILMLKAIVLPTWAVIAVGTPIFGLGCFVGIWMTRAISDDERELIRHACRRIQTFGGRSLTTARMPAR